jgi:hypothetical protein
MKALGEVLMGAAIGLVLGGLLIWGVMKLGDYIVRVTA